MVNLPTTTRRTTDWAKQYEMQERIRQQHYRIFELETRIESLECATRPASPAVLESLRRLIVHTRLPFSVPPKLSQTDANELLVEITRRLHAESPLERLA